MGLFSRKPQNPEDVALPLPELEEPEPSVEEDAEASDPPRVVKLDAADDADELDPLALSEGEAAPLPGAQPAARDDLLTMFQDLNYQDPVLERLLARVPDVKAEDLLLEAREVRLRLKGALPSGADG